MRYDTDKLVDVLWLLGVISLVIVIFFLLSFINSDNVGAKQSQTSGKYYSQVSDSPNTVTRGMASTIDDFDQLSSDFSTSASESIGGMGSAISDAGKAIGGGASSVASAAASGVATGVGATARGIGSGLSFIGSAIGSGASAVGDGFNSVANTPLISSLIRPSDSTEIPVIDPNSPELYAAITALPPEEAGADTAHDGPVWPISGRVTTEFGVPHRPWQPTHTGIDISDSKRSGETAIKPFRSGTVASVVHSRRGLGNHVIVDHGSGVTSVYAHLSSISVKQGENVNLGTILGYEGSTGASTGTHLHFEVRVNGQAADPRKFVPGQP